jgi:hypothetical protein
MRFGEAGTIGAHIGKTKVKNKGSARLTMRFGEAKAQQGLWRGAGASRHATRAAKKAQKQLKIGFLWPIEGCKSTFTPQTAKTKVKNKGSAKRMV